ncbi:MAG: NfeD family protein [Saccharospirillaceae bacterium]|nr:NfeD family protein [Pseudomonadales bacterium]NRB78740.1 NfeD family protein [Saccharospirillaceae bacterium]
MTLVDFITNNHDYVLYIIAAIAFLIELSVMGLSGPLFFFAIATLLTGILSSLGILNNWQIEIASVGVLTTVSAVVLWKPLKKFQNQGGGPDTSSDMIGKTVPSASEITKVSGHIRFSGINWNARLDESESESIAEAQNCVITGVDGNTMLVKKA